MGSITSALAAASQSLSAYSQALATVQTNIANAATPGYARQRINLAAAALPRASSQALGVEVQSIISLRDRLLEAQVFGATQTKAFFDKKTVVFQQIEPGFPLTGDRGIGASIDRFFASISALSVATADTNLRRGVLTAAGSLATTLRGTYEELSQQRSNLDTEARTVVDRINGLSREIAEIASQRFGADGSSNPAAETRLNQALTELGGLIDFSVLEQADGTLAVVAGGTTPLVVGAQAYQISASVSESRLRIVDSTGKEISAELQAEEGGQLGAILDVRNSDIPGYLAEINRLAKSIADSVNEQLARGIDLNGNPGQPLFLYTESAVTGAGRTAGTTGDAQPAQVGVTVNFTGGVTGSITANLDTFFVAAAPPTAASAGDTISVTFTSADGQIKRTITTAPLLGGETAADIAARLGDQIAVDPELSGLVNFSVAAGGELKVVLDEQAGQGFTFASATSNPGFTTGLEAGGSLGSQSADEIAAALNAEVALDANLIAAGIRFVATGGEIKLDGDIAFDFTVTDNDPNVPATGFASGLDGATGSAGGANAGLTLRVANLSTTELATGVAGAHTGNANVLALEALAGQKLLDGLTFTGFYAGFVTKIGGDISGAASQAQTQDQLLIAAQNLRDSFSGVDLNEEAVKLAEFEQAYQAILRVVQVLDGLSEDVLNLVS